VASYSNLILGSQTSFSALSTADIKAHLNITDSGQDSYVASLLAAAVVYVERRLQLDLRTTDWTLVLDQFPIWAAFNWLDRYGNNVYVYPAVSEYAVGRLTQRWQEIDLLRGPVQSITSIQYYDPSNVLQTYSSANYALVQPSFFPGRVEPIVFWPVSYPRPDAVQIQFVTGMTTPPANILHALKLICGQWYAARENISYGPGTVMGNTGCAVDALLDQFSVVGIG
jgi:hypothetical protein